MEEGKTRREEGWEERKGTVREGGNGYSLLMNT